MANTIYSANHEAIRRQNSNSQRNRKIPISSKFLQIPPCDQSRSAVVDVLIFIVVIFAFVFLLFPYLQLIITEFIKSGRIILYLVKDEFCLAPSIYFLIGFSISCAAIVTWGVVACTTRKCGNPNCKGLKKAAEFDIQFETEDHVKRAPSLTKNGVKKGLFKLPCYHHKELEAELKKMAPPNGRAVLVLRSRCGCLIGRLEVPGPKKHQKIKK